VGAPGPVHLFASGRRAPHVPSRQRDVHRCRRTSWWRSSPSWAGCPAEVLEHPELLALLVPLLRADMALTETYEHRDEPPLDDADHRADRDGRREGVARRRRGVGAPHQRRASACTPFPGTISTSSANRDRVIATLE
jgi:hypothetical protein